MSVPAQSALLPLEIRLRSLEAQVKGVSTSFQNLTESASLREQSSSRSVTRRVRELQEGLERSGGDSEGLKRLLAGYEQYLPLLSLPSADPALNPLQADRSEEPSRSIEADLLPDATKVTMLLEAAPDIRAAERDLREIKLLRVCGVEGSGMLEELLPLRNNLVTGMKEARQRSRELEKSRKEVSDLLTRYTEFTGTVSELFISLHRRMEGLEDHIAKIERSRRKEVAERF